MATTSEAIDKVLSLILIDQPLSSTLSHYGYGTAGFRFQASAMDGLMVRVGLLSVILLLEIPLEEDMGIMITASHNDESYNGVKLARPDGSMLSPGQEEFLTTWVNEDDTGRWKQLLQDQSHTLHASEASVTSQRTLHLGRDTRIHSPHLSKLCIEGAQAGIDALQLSSIVRVYDHGILTTPMLHHIVLHSNPHYLPPYISPKPSRSGYIETFAQAYVDLLRLGNDNNGCNKIPNSSTARLHVDGACGVGYQAVNEISQSIQDALGDSENEISSTLILAHNGPGDGPLNLDCGSEHVQTQLKPPIWYDGTPESSLEYCCALDGDADRIVFFGQDVVASVEETGNDDDVELPKGVLTHLLDGDKIALLIAHVLQGKLLGSVDDSSDTLPTMGIVQTAYANGASTEYVQVSFAQRYFLWDPDPRTPHSILRLQSTWACLEYRSLPCSYPSNLPRRASNICIMSQWKILT
jgi:phosphoacetylglucosamine mutase